MINDSTHTQWKQLQFDKTHKKSCDLEELALHHLLARFSRDVPATSLLRLEASAASS